MYLRIGYRDYKERSLNAFFTFESVSAWALAWTEVPSASSDRLSESGVAQEIGIERGPSEEGIDLKVNTMESISARRWMGGQKT